jgi:hypothetical protein
MADGFLKSPQAGSDHGKRPKRRVAVPARVEKRRVDSCGTALLAAIGVGSCQQRQSKTRVLRLGFQSRCARVRPRARGGAWETCCFGAELCRIRRIVANCTHCCELCWADSLARRGGGALHLIAPYETERSVVSTALARSRRERTFGSSDRIARCNITLRPYAHSP